jgi:hypothetical protein
MSAPTIVNQGFHAVVFTWVLTAADNVGVPIPAAYYDYADRCVQIAGTFDSSTVVFEGSNDGVNYHTLTDPHGNGISSVAASVEQVMENTLSARPNSSGGGGAQAVTVICVARRGRGGLEA